MALAYAVTELHFQTSVSMYLRLGIVVYDTTVYITSVRNLAVAFLRGAREVAIAPNFAFAQVLSIKTRSSSEVMPPPNSATPPRISSASSATAYYSLYR